MCEDRTIFCPPPVEWGVERREGEKEEERGRGGRRGGEGEREGGEEMRKREEERMEEGEGGRNWSIPCRHRAHVSRPGQYCHPLS